MASSHVSDLRVTNFAVLRKLCEARYPGDPSPFSDHELVGVAHELVAAATLAARPGRLVRIPPGGLITEDPYLAIVVRDLGHDQLADGVDVLPDQVWPRWLLLAKWCAPESVCSGAPEFVAAVVLAALAGTLGDDAGTIPHERPR